MTLSFHLKVCGVLLLLLAALHPVLARHFQWKRELAAVSLLTRQVFWVHTLFIGLILAQFGVLSLVFTQELIEHTMLARVVLAGLVLFWTVRLFAQHFVYSPQLWRGHRLNTAMHVLFTCLWTYFAVIYGAGLWFQIR